MKVSELGEFGLINLLAGMLPNTQKKQLIIGVGDDAAAWYSDDSIQLATVDSLIQDVHFSLSTTSWQELGWKALAVNLSDIAAMGGIPRYALISLALPGNTEVEDVAALYRGMIELAQQVDVTIVGGDTCRAPMVSVTVTVLGSTGNKTDPLRRQAGRQNSCYRLSGQRCRRVGDADGSDSV
ncbi:thiamine-monophosphate kinase [Chloroflexota bacterium]